jgi:hypothetical protein
MALRSRYSLFSVTKISPFKPSAEKKILLMETNDKNLLSDGLKYTKKRNCMSSECLPIEITYFLMRCPHVDYRKYPPEGVFELDYGLVTKGKKLRIARK